MMVIIDGYNVLRQVFDKVKGQLDRQRQQFIKQLSEYRQRRADKIKTLIVVFDGGSLDRATREIHSGVTVIFSGRKRTADEWIIEYVERNPAQEIFLVTLDRELIEKCRTRNVDVLDVFEFYAIVQRDQLQRVQDEVLQKTALDIQVDSASEGPNLSDQALEILMQQAVREAYSKDDDYHDARHRKGSSHTLSKKEKKQLEKLKKIW